MTLGAIGRRVLAALGAGAVALSTLAAVPAAAQDSSWWNSPQPDGTWVAFRLENLSPSPDSRTTYEPVTVVRESSNGDGSVDEAWINNWDFDNSQDPPTTLWPLQFSSGGILLERVDACPFGQSSCRYRIVDGQGSEFWFFGGNPPLVGGVQVPDPRDYAGTIDLPPLTIQLGTPQAAPGDAGRITLTAPGTSDPLGELTYEWVLVHLDTGTEYASGILNTDVFEATVQHNGQYCVQLTVTAAADGATAGTPTCAAGGTGGGIFDISNVVAPVDPPPSGGGGTGGGGGIGGGGGGIPGIGFSNPVRRAPSSLTGGGSAAPTVVWLWRPEWYQSAPEPVRQPETSGQPAIKARGDIVVSGPTPRGSNAGPWLAGVGIFGALGGSWLVSRRRRQRMLAEL
jgi:hypothetical protein